MAEKETLIYQLEKGRAEIAYKCVLEVKENYSSNRSIQSDYRSYVKKIPQMILSNGLGQTLVFIVSKKQKEKSKDQPGSENNPKNAYDLIYKQLIEYMKSEHTAGIQMPQDKTELVEWVISCNSTEYRYITQEILAFLNWLRRFVEGMIEEK